MSKEIDTKRVRSKKNYLEFLGVTKILIKLLSTP